MRGTSSGPRPVRILVVDDQTLFREGLVSLLNDVRGLSVVGEAEDGVEALRQVAAQLPDVVLMDVRMPRFDGIRATAQIAAEYPSVRVVMLASAQVEETMLEALAAGALGYVLKDSDRDTLVGAIRQAARGERVLSHDSLRALAGVAVAGTRRRPPPDELTARQFEILRLMSLGLELKQIGRQLGISGKTVRNQASLMYARLRVHDRAEAILYAAHKGIAA
jgi:DNA-binding NarL/FixJ family response regulator